MHDDVLIAEFGLRAHRADHEGSVSEIVERVFLFDMFDLVVGDGRLGFGIPVHDTRPAVDKACLVHTDEGLHDRLIPLFVHRVGIARPVERSPHRAHLREHRALVLFYERIDTGKQIFAPDIVSCLLFFLIYVLFDAGLRGDSRRISARHPERLIALHAVIADERIFDRKHEGRSHVERAGDVRRRKDYRKNVFSLSRQVVGIEIAAFLPALIDTGFGRLRVVGFEELVVHFEKTSWLE